MPSLAKRPCPVPGCTELVFQGRCVLHQKRAEQQREKTNERGYDNAWEKLRIQCFIRDNWRCQECGWEPHIVTVSKQAGVELPAVPVMLEVLRNAYARHARHLQADHIRPIEDRPELRLVLENLATLCNTCHSRKTARENGGFGNAVQCPQNRAETRGNAAQTGAISSVGRALQAAASAERHQFGR